MKKFQQFFYVQETTVLSSHFTQLLYSLMMGQYSLKHVRVNGSYNIIVNLIHCLHLLPETAVSEL